MSAIRSLHELPLQTGLAFGDWAIWRHHDGDNDVGDLFVVHPECRWVVYSPIMSNGWFNFLDDAAQWRLHYGYEGYHTHEQDRDALNAERYFEMRPAGVWPTGTFNAAQWTIEVWADRLRLLHPMNDWPIVLWPGRRLWTWGKKPIPGCCGCEQ